MSSILYRVLAKTLVIALRPLLPQVVDTCQTAFQQDQFLSDNTRQVQDLVEYCDAEDVSGLLLFCDQDNAYPRVDWEFMFGAMETMNVHPEFVQLVRMMYTGVRLHFKPHPRATAHTVSVRTVHHGTR